MWPVGSPIFCPNDRADLRELAIDDLRTNFTEEEMKIIGAMRSSEEEDQLLARQIADDVGCYVQKVAKFGEKLERDHLIQRKMHEDKGKNLTLRRQQRNKLSIGVTIITGRPNNFTIIPKHCIGPDLPTAWHRFPVWVSAELVDCHTLDRLGGYAPDRSKELRTVQLRFVSTSLCESRLRISRFSAAAVPVKNRPAIVFAPPTGWQDPEGWHRKGCHWRALAVAAYVS